jgi:DUF1365 family protein
MTNYRSCLYMGTVAHKRLAPRRHGFAYRVFSLCLDVDEVDLLDRRLRLFSRNRWNVLGIRDRDLGDSTDTSVGAKARRLLSDAGLSAFGHRIELICYPRIFGYVFNPLSVYFCRDEVGVIGAMIYEVSNTFRERRAYLIEVPDGQSHTIAQACTKELYVSPFTSSTGSYSFHVRPPGDDLVIGVAFREGDRPVLKTHFRGERVTLSDWSIARLLAGNPMMTLKVIGAIHFEAARLWVKGVPIEPRFASERYASTIVRPRLRESQA